MYVYIRSTCIYIGNAFRLKAFLSDANNNSTLALHKYIYIYVYEWCYGMRIVRLHCSFNICEYKTKGIFCTTPDKMANNQTHGHTVTLCASFVINVMVLNADFSCSYIRMEQHSIGFNPLAVCVCARGMLSGVKQTNECMNGPYESKWEKW